MPYRDWVVPAGQKALQVLRDEMRTRMAANVLDRLSIHEDDDTVWLDMADVPAAHLDDLLGLFFAWFSHSERRKVARSADDVDTAMAKVILDCAGLGLHALDDTRFSIDAGALCHLLSDLDQLNKRRDALRRQRTAERQTNPKCE